MSQANDYKYILIDPFKMTTDRWNVALQERYGQCRKLPDGSIILKYRGSHPILFFGHTTYSNDEISAILEALED